MSSRDDRSDFENRKLAKALDLGRDEQAFGLAARALHAADRHDYPYLWSWWGVPIIQLPADIVTTQEVIFATRPQVIIETGVARGGSVIFMASILELIGAGKVVGVDIDIRPHNRASIEGHPMARRIHLIEGSSTNEAIVEKIRAQIPPGAPVMVVLDSDHSKEHVLAELRAYGPMVTKGQYMIVADTLLGRLDPAQAPTLRSKVLLRGDEPLAAVEAYLLETNRFEPDPAINGKLIFASSPGGYLRCKSC
jgi:cephalosporin hydroxylase